MGKVDWTWLLVGIAIGYLVVPRVIGAARGMSQA